MPACVAQHVGVSVGQARSFACRCQHLANVRSGHWPTVTLASKHKRPGSSAPYLAQGPKLIALDWVNAGDASFQSPDVQMSASEIDLIPLQIDGLAYAQAMTRHEED